MNTPKGGSVLAHASVRRLSLLVAIATLLAALPAAAATVTGRVVDPSARAVPGAQVIVLCGQRVAATAVTDADGRFVTADVRGRCELRVALQGFAAKPVPLDLAEQSSPVDAGTVTLEVSAVSESVVVSAAQVDVPLSQASSSITVITGAELKARQMTTVADALREVPGLSVVRSGTIGAVTSVFPRGGESDYSLVMIDDVPVNAFGGGFDFSHLSADDIDRIEIVRGPQSAQFGSNAIGAVVRVITRQGGPLRGDVAVEGGSFGTSRVMASSAGRAGEWFWGAGLERLATDNANGERTAAGDVVSNADYTRTGTGASGGWRRSNGAAIRGDVRFERNDLGLPGPFGSNPVGAFEGIDTVSREKDDRWIASVTGTLPTGRRVRTHAEWTWNTIDSDFASPFGPSTSGSRRWTLRAQSDIHIVEGLDLSAGAEFQRERANSTFITDDTFAAIPVRRSVAGYFGEARWSSGERLYVTGGLRVDDITRDALAGVSDPFSPRPPFPEDHVVSANPRVAAAWYLMPPSATATKLRAAAATGIRPPDAFEIAFTDNPSLKPERSRSVEAGVDQPVADGHVLLQATFFHNTFDDLIIAVGPFDGSSRYRTDNISNARARGLELGSTVRTQAGPVGLQAQIGYTFLDSDILAVDRAAAAPPPFEPGDPLLRRPRHQWFVDLAAVHGPLTAWVRGGGRGRVLDVEPTLGTFGGLFEAAGYAVWNAGGSWSIKRRVELFARVENLFDRSYEEAFGFPALGRGVMAGVRVAASR
ncbi:MAG TPA: TonB-dependent receptor [Vicinamibacterales bacterium]